MVWAEQTKQFRLAGQQIERVGVHHGGHSGLEHGANGLRRGTAGKPAADDGGILPAQRFSKRGHRTRGDRAAALLERHAHRLRRKGLQHGNDGRRTCDCDQPRARPQRRERTHRRRAGHAERACDDQQMTALALVDVARPRRKQARDVAGIEQFRIEDVLRKGGKADVRHAGLAGHVEPIAERQPGLEILKGDRPIGAHAGRKRLSRAAVQPRRDVCRIDAHTRRRAVGVDPLDQPGFRAGRRTGQPRAEQRVHPRVRARQIVGMLVHRNAAGARPGKVCHRVGMSGRPRLDDCAAVAAAQQPRARRAVAAIAAGSAGKVHRRTLGQFAGNRIGQRLCRALHDRNRRHAALAEPLFLRPAHRAGRDEPAHGSPSSQVRAHSARVFFPIIAHQRGGRQILKTQGKPSAVAGERRICAFQRVQPTTRRPWRSIRGSTSNAFMRRGCR